MPTTTTTTARDTLNDTVLPAMRNGLLVAREKGHELLDSDAAHEARRRGTAMLKAARGEPVVMVPRRQRIGFMLMLLTIGAGIGAGAAWLMRRMAAPVESYRIGSLPVPSGTDGGARLAADDVDLRAGSPIRH